MVAGEETPVGASYGPTGDRYERYLRVAEAAAACESFTLAELKAACRQERPHFVTRTVNELAKAGFLVRQGSKSRPAFRWDTARKASFSPADWARSAVSGAQIQQTPASDRPRERLLSFGAATLRTAELFAILIRSGRPGESALQAGEKLAARYGDQLERLPRAGRAELKAVSAAVRETAYCQIMAGIELGRRVAAAAARQAERKPRRILGPDEAIEECRERFARLAQDGAQEEFHIMCLNTKNEVIGTHRVSVGGLDASTAGPREVFRPAIQEAAHAVLLVHNHPSGAPTPSRADLTVTERLEQAGELLGVPVLDHIIVAAHGCVSVRQYRAKGF